MSFLEQILENMADNSNRKNRTLVVGNNLTTVNDNFRKYFGIGYVNDKEQSSYATRNRYIFRFNIIRGIKKNEFLDIIKSRGIFNEVFIYCSESIEKTLTKWIKDHVSKNIKITLHTEKDKFLS